MCVGGGGWRCWDVSWLSLGALGSQEDTGRGDSFTPGTRDRCSEIKWKRTASELGHSNIMGPESTQKGGSCRMW